jgi:thiol-disulfide isomerase/thioredoxin
VYLFEVENGATKLVKSTRTSADGTFSIAFDPVYEGFYIIGGFKELAGQYPIYVKKNEQINLKIEKKELTFTDQVSTENKSLENWNQLKRSVVSDATKTKAENMATLATKAKSFLGKMNSTDKLFTKQMKSFVTFEQVYEQLKPMNSALSAIHFSALGKVFKTDDVFAYPKGKELICLYAHTGLRFQPTKKAIDFLESDRQKGLYVYEEKLLSAKTYANYEEVMQEYGQYFKDSNLEAKVEALGTKLLNEKVGAKGSAFSLPDRNGNLIGLKDFKGKVVVINVWATYCAPCKAQMPFLDRLKKKLEGEQDLFFVGVAFDGPKGKETWKKMIVEKNMTGIQLFGGGGGNLLAKDYAIKAMPRYLIFDRDGKLVTAHALPPGNAGLEKMILETLKKK